MRKIYGVIALSVLLNACQKEIDWGLNAGSDGDLLVKATEISVTTNDTNIISFQYDAQRRLTEYQSAGKVNGTPTNIRFQISRASDGRITKIHARTSLASAFIDSTVYFPVYNGNRLAYVIDTQYSSLMNIRDSVAYVYNGLGQCTEMERYTDILGSMEPITRQTFVYDASGNLLTEIMNIPDGGGGWDLVSTTNYTYNSHKTAVQLGDESYIVLPVSNTSRNTCTRQEVVSLFGGNITYTMTDQTYNNFDRPRKATISFTPQPPGYDTKVAYSYQ